MNDQVPPPPPVVDQAPPRRRTFLWAGLAVLIAVVSFVTVAGLLVQAMGWRSFYHPSGSMLPTLIVGDYFFVDRDAYGHGRLPGRGDIIAFYAPAQAYPTSGGRRVEFIKRIVGLPGDSIAMKAAAPIINGRAVEWQVLREEPYRMYKATRLQERLADGTSYEILKYSKGQQGDEGGPFTVPAGAYFVLGDNRDNSIDSRGQAVPGGAWWFVPAADIIGRANYIYWSGFERIGRIGVALK